MAIGLVETWLTSNISSGILELGGHPFKARSENQQKG